MQCFTIEGFGNFMESLSCQNFKIFTISFGREKRPLRADSQERNEWI